MLEKLILKNEKPNIYIAINRQKHMPSGARHNDIVHSLKFCNIKYCRSSS